MWGMAKMRMRVALLLVLVAWAGASGCYQLNPFLIGHAPIPIPVPPWVSERMEEKYAHRLLHRTPIMPPILPGQPLPVCEDPPSEEEIIRALPRVARGVPYLYEEFRDDFTFVTEKIVDQIDPVTFIPLVGSAQLHHCHFKCTVYYRERITSHYPFPFTVVNDRVQVVYIDKDHLHLAAGPDERYQATFTKELSGY
jgi:hypothetical protein